MAAGTAIGSAIVWAVKRITRSQDRSTNALIESARSDATLTARFDALDARLDRALQGMVPEPIPDDPRPTRASTRDGGSDDAGGPRARRTRTPHRGQTSTGRPGED